MKPFIQSLKSLTLALILVGGVSAVSAANTWTAPTVGAPNGNVDAPINVSPVTQFKKGGIVIEGLNASNEILAFPFSVLNGNVGIGTATPDNKLSVIGSVQIKDGTEGVGKVLTSDADGVASWQTAGTVSGGGSGVSKIVAGPGISVTPVEGAGEVTVASKGHTFTTLPVNFPPDILCPASSVSAGSLGTYSPAVRDVVLRYSGTNPLNNAIVEYSGQYSLVGGGANPVGGYKPAIGFMSFKYNASTGAFISGVAASSIGNGQTAGGCGSNISAAPRP